MVSFRKAHLGIFSQPMLVEIAKDFDVSYDAVSRIPTLVQAGYGVGIVLISPLGDLVRRRQLCMLLMLLTTGLSVALARASSVEMLEGVSFIVGMLTVSRLPTRTHRLPRCSISATTVPRGDRATADAHPVARSPRKSASHGQPTSHRATGAPRPCPSPSRASFSVLYWAESSAESWRTLPVGGIRTGSLWGFRGVSGARANPGCHSVVPPSLFPPCLLLSTSALLSAYEQC
jgi:MFS family permease